MIERATLITRAATFYLAYSGKYSYLLGDSGTGKGYLVDLLGQILFGYQASMEGPRKVVGGPHGVAIDHLNDDNALLVFGEDYDAMRIKSRWEKISKSVNPCIFMTRDMIPTVPYTDENVFTMKRISDKEFSMVPVPGGLGGVVSLF